MLTYLSYVKGWKLRCQTDTQIVQKLKSSGSEQSSNFEIEYLWSIIGGTIMGH